ncbi:C2 calcium-dependent membrane targeting [Cynara cardunculus var. scolymus]|uniref:C2 calcium-dependent membrane targeting n=1 Tax=Cynara cardunculus var. scolymus TaxID=59895 RepID=A0A118JX19_CYNCS|nr:C2 calcium-dependent membrane targeting [Cynara cardunculus var. scolymus]
MEITIISAQGLKKTSALSSIFSHRHLRPFITLTTTPPSAAHGGDPSHVYTTTVDHEGGVNPSWGDKFDLSSVIDASFFYHKYSCIYLQLYTNRLLLGPRFLGWCGIPATDLADGFSPAGTVRQLSYRLRKKDGSRAHGVVNVVVKLDSSIFQARRRVDSDVRRLPEMTFGGVAIGIPVKMLPAVSDHQGSSSVIGGQNRY